MTFAYPRFSTACNCNGLADSCLFDQQLYRSTGRGGRCVACKNNTDGANCERCKIHHYRKFFNEACKPCKCNPIGSRRPQCNSDGQCSCQPGVYGQKCDKCRPGFFGFSKTGCKYVTILLIWYLLLTASDPELLALHIILGIWPPFSKTIFQKNKFKKSNIKRVNFNGANLTLKYDNYWKFLTEIEW